MDPTSLSSAIKATAVQLGFNLVVIAPAVTPRGINHFAQWLAAGYAGQMHYLGSRAAAYADPSRVLDGARSVIMIALNYRTAAPVEAQAGRGRVSRYAWGHDYHDSLRQRLDELGRALQEFAPAARVRGVVDTAPLLEREFAQLAGLGWIGKNTLLLNRRAGSWFFLGALLTNIELAYDAPHETDHCGTCRACLDACPTDAFVEPYVLDARKCISYLTIEARGPAPRELRTGLGDWLFGCDICQEVCPWNHHAPLADSTEFEPLGGQTTLDLCELFTLDDQEFRDLFRHTPLWRAKRRGLLRNAAYVLGNQRATAAIAALVKGLHDEEPLVRSASAWALGQLNDATPRDALRERLTVETDSDVLQEIELALGTHASGSQQEDYS